MFQLRHLLMEFETGLHPTASSRNDQFTFGPMPNFRKKTLTTKSHMELKSRRPAGKKFGEDRHALTEALDLKFCEIAVIGFRRILEAGAVGSCSLQHDVWEGLEECQDEVIRMLGFDAEICEGLTGKVGQIERDDDA